MSIFLLFASNFGKRHNTYCMKTPLQTGSRGTVEGEKRGAVEQNDQAGASSPAWQRRLSAFESDRPISQPLPLKSQWTRGFATGNQTCGAASFATRDS